MTATESGGSPASVPSAATRNAPPTYGKSWAEDIQKYHAAKATLPWRPEERPVVKHVTRYEKSREEREYDLVLGKFRDAEKEIAKQTNEGSSRKQSLERSRALQLRNVQRFNLINHSPAYIGARDPKDPPPETWPDRRPLRRTSAVDYNIVTNVPRSLPDANAAASASPASPPTSPAAHNRRLRDFNILTNKFQQQHEQRELEERTRAKELAAVKFDKKNTFNPVRIAFYDPNREQEFVQARAQEQQVHGKDRVLKLPPREQFAEGKIYNIVNQSVINSTQITRYDHRPPASKQLKQEVETRLHAYGDYQAEREEQLCLNRFAHERHTQAFVHGYDPITNQPFDGISAKPRVPTRTHEALPAWQVLEKGVPSTTKIAVMAMTKPQFPTASSSAPASASAFESANRRANIMVVDHGSTGSSQGVKSPNVVVAKEQIRTGGFS